MNIRLIERRQPLNNPATMHLNSTPKQRKFNRLSWLDLAHVGFFGLFLMLAHYSLT